MVSVFVFCGYGLFVFLDSVSVLRFNSVLFRMPFRLAMLISVLGFVFLFSGSVFLFRFVLCLSVLALFFPIFVVVAVVLWLFLSIGHPIYLIDFCI